ncbi:hypothetical protein [Butyrivibrio sp. MC2013]|uniref:hypothetical protein n=1 Tax=Butyrivibrio sp. MC2013 TaxID=1280686 RepID=UPI000429440C|nr:hypothetical protein [Butyrivibrio sp. MC2013]
MSSVKEQVEELYSKGMLDDDRKFSYANAVRLPDGSYGLVCFGINKDRFLIWNADYAGISGKIKELLYDIPMSEMEEIKGNDIPVLANLRFKWQGGSFHFKAFAYNRYFVKTIKERSAVAKAAKTA